MGDSQIKPVEGTIDYTDQQNARAARDYVQEIIDDVKSWDDGEDVKDAHLTALEYIYDVMEMHYKNMLNVYSVYHKKNRRGR